MTSVAATGSGPFAVEVDPAGRFAFVSNTAETSGAPSISVFAIDQNTGALTPVPGSPFPTGLRSPQGLKVHPSGKFLYVAHDLQASFVSAYSINAQTGALTPLPGSPYSTGGVNAWSVSTDPAGKFLFVANGGSGNIPVFTIDANTGALTSIAGSPFASQPDVDKIAVDPSGRFLYADNTTFNTVSGYSINSSSGALTPVTGSPFATGATPLGVVTDRAGRFLYVTNRDSASVSAFSIDSTTGSLAAVSGSPFPVGSLPYHATVDPTGSFLYVTNFGSNNVTAYAINASTGSLTPVPGSPFTTGTAPFWIAIATVTPSTQLTIQPNVGGNTGNVTVQLFGGGVQNGATVKLAGVGPDIIGTDTISTIASALTTTFNLLGATPGIRDVVITNPDGTSATLLHGFAVEQGGSPNVTISIIGRDRIRFGSPQIYYGLIQNHGIIDAVNVAAFVSQSTGVQSPSGFFGPVPALTSLTIPFTAIGPTSGSPQSCPFRVTGGLHTVLSGDPCSVFEAAKAAAEAYLNNSYGQRLANLKMLEQSVISQGCFNPSDPSSSIKCYNFEFADKSYKVRIDAVDAFKKGLCSFAASVGCPLDCGDPLEINELDRIGAVVANSVEQLKEIFLHVPISLDEVQAQVSQIAQAETRTRALPNSLVFPPQPQPQPPTALPLDDSSSLQVCAVGSLDPNSKTGAVGAGMSQFIKANLAVPYSVSFGNITSASAPAQSVTVTDALNTNLDLTSVTLGSLSFPGYVVTAPSVPLLISPFITTVDLRPTTNLLVDIKVTLDSTTGVLTSTFQSIDPATNQPPTDPLVGFLPPGADGDIFFTVIPKPGLPTNAQIQNQATIVFDVNPPINTPTWINTIDNTQPTSQVATLPAFENAPSFPVQWTGNDVGAGIQDFTIFVSDNSGPFTAFQTNTTARSATFTGQAGHTYAFYSIARDLVGNVEPAKSAAESNTQVVPDTTPPVSIAAVSSEPNVNGWNNSNVVVTINSTDNELVGTGIKQVSYSATGAQTIASTVVNGASTSFTITAEGITTITFFGTDNAGNTETARTITINIDKTPPAMACSASPNVLWPPNNKLVPVNVSVNVTDSLSGPAGFNLVSVTSSEPDCGHGDIQGFVVGSGSTSGRLRAKRLGSGSGRTYTFVYSGADRAGNATSCTTTVVVPHDQGH
jgi:6-phosphogluconolactonase (cycloisomerase 2 family)